MSAGGSRPRREALYVGDAVGRRQLELSGIAVQAYDGGKPAPERALIVATGGGRKLAENAAAVADFLKAGGHLLALGLDQQEANSFLPFKVGMTQAEHIAAFFEPPSATSLLAGVAPADVQNRDPRKLPLVSAGATLLGDGVLAQAQNVSVVFFQFPPYAVRTPYRERRIPASSLTCDGRTAAPPSPSAPAGQYGSQRNDAALVSFLEAGERRPAQARRRDRRPMVARSVPRPARSMGRSVPFLPLVKVMP